MVLSYVTNTCTHASLRSGAWRSATRSSTYIHVRRAPPVQCPRGCRSGAGRGVALTRYATPSSRATARSDILTLYSIIFNFFYSIFSWVGERGWVGRGGRVGHSPLAVTIRDSELECVRLQQTEQDARDPAAVYAYETTGSLHHLAPRASVEKPRSLSPVHPGSADTSPSPKVPGPRFSDPAPASRRGVCARPSSAAVLAERTTALKAACSSPERDCPRPRLSPRHTLAPEADTPSAGARARASRCCALDLWQDAMCLQTSW